MNQSSPFVLVPALITLEFVALGWRITREIAVGDAGRRTWLLASDLINLVLMIAVVVACVVVPLKIGTFPQASKAVIGAAYTFMCFTPATLAGHYRLFSRLGRAIYRSKADYPRITDQEALMLVAAPIASGTAAYFIVS